MPVLDEKRSDLTNTIGYIKELLAIQIDDELNFNLHINNICRLGVKQPIVSNISNFIYCPLVWIFSSAFSVNKIEDLQNKLCVSLYPSRQLHIHS